MKRGMATLGMILVNLVLLPLACTQEKIIEVVVTPTPGPTPTPVVVTKEVIMVTPMPRAPLDDTPRTALISAFGLEADVYLAEMTREKVFTISGFRFTTGELRGKQVVVVLTNISISNAVMVTQLLLDNFNVERIIMSGIAGGVNPDLNIGDVVIAERWALYQEMFFQRPFALFVGGVDQAGFLAFNAADDLVEHRLGGLLV